MRAFLALFLSSCLQRCRRHRSPSSLGGGGLLYSVKSRARRQLRKYAKLKPSATVGIASNRTRKRRQATNAPLSIIAVAAPLGDGAKSDASADSRTANRPLAVALICARFNERNGIQSAFRTNERLNTLAIVGDLQSAVKRRLVVTRLRLRVVVVLADGADSNEPSARRIGRANQR